QLPASPAGPAERRPAQGAVLHHRDAARADRRGAGRRRRRLCDEAVRRRDPAIQTGGGGRDHPMTPEDFDRLQSLLASRAGYRLSRDRMQLAEHRLGPVARREGYANVEALLANLWAQPVASLGWTVIESLLNPETWFRRDRAPFEVFE